MSKRKAIFVLKGKKDEASMVVVHELIRGNVLYSKLNDDDEPENRTVMGQEVFNQRYQLCGFQD